MRRASRTYLLILAAGLATGCSRDEPRPGPAAPPPSPSEDALRAAPAALVDAPPPPRAYPAVTTEARASEMVMVAVSGGAPLAVVEEGARVTFRRAQLVGPGASTSTVILDGAPVEVANAALIRFPADAQAARGELVLTASDDAKLGLELARVVVGPARTPEVAALADGFLRVNQGPRRRLAPGSFLPVSEAGGAGSGMAVPGAATGAPVLRFVVRADGDQVLLMRRSGELSVRQRARCLPLPLRPPLATDVTVQATEMDQAFRPVRVVGVDPQTGEIRVALDIGPDGAPVAASSRTITVAAPMYWPAETFPAPP